MNYPTPFSSKAILLFSSVKLLSLCLLLGWGSLFAQQADEAPKGDMRVITFDNLPAASEALRLSADVLEIQETDDLILSKTFTDRLGYTHDRMQQYYQGIKVENAVWTIHQKQGRITSMSGNAKALGQVTTFASITEENALQAALDHAQGKRYMWQHFGHRHMYPKAEKVIYKGPEGKMEPRLCYKFDIYATEPLYRADVYIDAMTGNFIGENQKIHHANVAASGATLYNGIRNFTADSYNGSYRLRQTSSGSGVRTYSLNNGVSYGNASDVTSSTTNFTSNPTAVQAHWASEQVYDYFLQDHSRNSYDGNGSVLQSYVNYGTNYVNAFWDGVRMTYGDGNGSTYGPLVSIDIVGHEIAHGVTQNSANLVYMNQSGALNESFSDIFGECIEKFATGTNDWLMGDDITLGNTQPLRSMSNPNARNHPDTYYGTHWYTGAGDNGGVHYNSGVQNKWFYILVNGESGTNDINDAYNVTGIGMDKAADIAYRNLTVYLTPNSNYYDARLGAIESAINLFGANSAEVIATTNAWYAVGIGDEYGVTSFCNSRGLNTSRIWIDNVGVNSTNYPSGTQTLGYQDYTNNTFSALAGAAASLNLSSGNASNYATYGRFWKVWIDYNNDGDFEDPGEEVYANTASSPSVSNAIINVPVNVSGSARMRVSMSSNPNFGPCSMHSYGEVEDYTIVFTSVTACPNNQAPTISTTVSGTYFHVTDPVTISAIASDPDGTVQLVVFYSGNTVIGVDNSAPFSMTTTSLPGANHYIYAVAYDNCNDTAHSNGTYVFVLDPCAGNIQPSVSVAVNDPIIDAGLGETLIVTANASDTDGTVDRVVLLVSGQLLSDFSAPPYQWSGQPQFAGTWDIWAIAFDDCGDTTWSNTITITVTHPCEGNRNPYVGRNVSASTLTQGQPLTINAFPNDPDGNLKDVEFLVNNVVVFTDDTPPYTHTTTNLVLGGNGIRVRATDSCGASQLTGALTVVVNPAPCSNNQAPTVNLNLSTTFADAQQGDSVVFDISASDADGTITEIVFLADGNIVDISTGAAIRNVVYPIFPGVYEASAFAVDNCGDTTHATPVDLTVVNACYGLPGPSGSLAPTQNPININQTVTFNAFATDPNNDLNRVEFHVGGQIVHTDYAAPYTHSMSFATAGQYTIEIWIYDDCGSGFKPGATFLTVNNNTTCNVSVDSEDFESGWGIWIDGGADAMLRTNGAFANSGVQSAGIQDNTSTSVITTVPLNLITFTELTVAFSYYAVSMDNANEDFWLQISTDGGSTYTTVEEWNESDEFVNNVRYNDQVTIQGPFPADTRIRFRCDASGNGDDVYLDDIVLTGCSWGSEPCRVFGDSDGDAICDPFDSCPNLDNSLIGLPCDDGDANTTGDVWGQNCACAGVPAGCGIVIDAEDFEGGFGDWNDGGADCIRANNAAFANSGTYSINLQDDGATANMTTDLFDLSAYNEVTVAFSYFTVSMDNSNEDFWLQISLDGGATFTTVEEWNLNDEFVNNTRYNDQVVLQGPFSANAKFRFRCDASGNADDVYIDDVLITGCQGSSFNFGIMGEGPASNTQGGDQLSEITIPESTISVFPNPFSDVLNIVLDKGHGYDRIVLMDIQGKVIDTKHIGEATREVRWDIQDIAAGVYNLRLTGKGEATTKRLVKTTD
ncbi:MAG: M4 family metallopeptidase [Bacteroidia bacterium]